MERYRRRDDEEHRQCSDVDTEREEECGICMEMNSKIVLPYCNHAMCLKCYREWYFHLSLKLFFFFFPPEFLYWKWSTIYLVCSVILLSDVYPVDTVQYLQIKLIKDALDVSWMLDCLAPNTRSSRCSEGPLFSLIGLILVMHLCFQCLLKNTTHH